MKTYGSSMLVAFAAFLCLCLYLGTEAQELHKKSESEYAEYAEFITDADAALLQSPTQDQKYTILLRRALGKAGTGDADGAMADIRLAQECNPQWAEETASWKGIVDNLVKWKKYEEAVCIWEDCVEHNPKNYTTVMGYAQFLVTHRDDKWCDPEKAEKLIRQALPAEDEWRPVELVLRAQVEAANGRFEEARRTLKEAEQKNPDYLAPPLKREMEICFSLGERFVSSLY